MKILMTGATGLIGKELGLELARKGHELLIVSRSAQKARMQVPFPCEVIEGDLTQGVLIDSRLNQVDAVIHLLGEGVAEKRWSKKQKQKIMDSRVLGTRHLVNSFSRAPKIFISASAIGFYGDRGNEELNEKSSVGQGFLPEVCVNWEIEADAIQNKGDVRQVKARIGVVLAENGGALEKMLPPFQAGVGGPLASGKQWMSWVHIQDIVGLFCAALENTMLEGVVNFVAPNPATNYEFSKLLAQTIHRWMGPAVPAFVLKIMFGELAQVLLASQKVKPEKAQLAGYRFKFADLEMALKDVLNGPSSGEEILVAKQFVPKKIEETFSYFCEAKNLESLTPDLLHFHVEKMSTEKIQEGSLIDYRLRIRGVPAKWRTMIKKWNPPYEFVDTSLKGPYKLWHHTHKFENLGNGTLMTDRVRYVLPMGYVGWLGGNWLVKKDVRAIFDFRRKQIAKVFSHEA